MNPHLTKRANPQPRHRLVLWAALLLMVLCGLLNNVHIEACVGDCCAQHAAAVAKLTATSDDAAKSCCCCRKGDEQPAPGERNRGRCDTGCCVAFDFAVEIGPVESASTWQLPCLPQGMWIGPALRRELPPHKPRPRRRFDRGPPRVDQRVAQRATVQLLI